MTSIGIIIKKPQNGEIKRKNNDGKSTKKKWLPTFAGT